MTQHVSLEQTVCCAVRDDGVNRRHVARVLGVYVEAACENSTFFCVFFAGCVVAVFGTRKCFGCGSTMGQNSFFCLVDSTIPQMKLIGRRLCVMWFCVVSNGLRKHAPFRLAGANHGQENKWHKTRTCHSLFSNTVATTSQAGQWTGSAQNCPKMGYLATRGAVIVVKLWDKYWFRGCNYALAKPVFICSFIHLRPLYARERCCPQRMRSSLETRMKRRHETKKHE